jgi:hypothetical protein
MYLMLPVSLDCPFLMAPSVFSNVFFSRRVIPQISTTSWILLGTGNNNPSRVLVSVLGFYWLRQEALAIPEHMISFLGFDWFI